MKLREQKHKSFASQKQNQEREIFLLIQVRTLTEKLQSISETAQENKVMQSRLASLGIEKEELQVSLETLRQEKRQLTADLENRVETVCV